MYMPLQDFRATFESALNAIPHCVGVNNHTGSLLTQNLEPMNWLMATIRERDLYFLDSRTTAQTVVFSTAAEHQIPVLKRDVFLDHQLTTEAIDQAFKRALVIAQSQGYAVIIAHPHEKSIRYLEQALPQLANNPDYSLVTASQLLNKTALNRVDVALHLDPVSLHRSPGR